MSCRAKHLPDLFFVLQGPIPDKGFDVYAVDAKVGGDDDIKPGIKFLFNFKPCNPLVCRDDNMAVVVCGSKLCAVGGDYDRRFGAYAREFLQFDLTNWKNRKDDFKPDKFAPKPKGGKPYPMVFVHEKKLYALAGVHVYSRDDPDAPDPAFEVYDPYDPYGPSWKPLEPPPFPEFYPGPLNTRCLKGYKFVNETLYLALCNSLEPDLYFTYSVRNRTWERIQVDKSDTLLSNLTLYGLYTDWKAREDFVGLTGFHLTGKKVLAHDLTVRVDESMITKDPDARPHWEDDDPVIKEDEDYPYLLVHGLDDIAKLGANNYSTGFVAHLTEDIFCAVYIINSNRKCNIHACTFELHKQCSKQGFELTDTLQANVLGNADYSTDWNWVFRYQWGKMDYKSHGARRGRGRT